MMNIPNSTYRIPIPDSRGLRFGAGKVKLLSDFDGTYLPSRQSDLQDDEIAKTEKAWLDPYFERFGKFLSQSNQAEPTVEFVITTGRNRGEFEVMSDLIRRRNIRMPMPDSLITNNGADEFTKTVPDEQYYQGGPFPFPWESANQEKKDAIREATGWDGPKIRDKILAVLQGYHFNVRQDPTTNSARDYGPKSTLYYVHDHFNYRNKQYQLGEAPISPWAAALRQDGDLGFFLGFPKDMPHHPERQRAYEDISNQIKQYVYDNMKPYHFLGRPERSYFFKFREQERDYGNHPALTIRPQIAMRPLDKSYDAKRAIEAAIRNQDLVIVAGDSSNDVQMLNPAGYIPLPEALQQRNYISSFVNNPGYFNTMRESHPELQQEIDKLPFIGIVIDNPDKPNFELRKLVEVFGNGPNKRIIQVNQGDLLEGVQEAIRIYAEQNPAFKAKMADQLKAAVGLTEPKPVTTQSALPVPLPVGVSTEQESASRTQIAASPKEAAGVAEPKPTTPTQSTSTVPMPAKAPGNTQDDIKKAWYIERYENLKRAALALCRGIQKLIQKFMAYLTGVQTDEGVV